ncbi:MAG: Peptidylprolyl isomerase [Nevskia sp.]|nr:Peptidylprolyl isomerase [Nevskia sp.]
MSLPKLLLVALILVPLAAAAQGPKAPVVNYQVTTGDGLKYSDLKLGTGPSPRTGQTVIVHYVGTLDDGSTFDSSRDRGQPFRFVIGTGQVIDGWDEGVATMKRGGRRLLHVPASLGYGASGAGDAVPPNAALNFDIELLDIR